MWATWCGPCKAEFPSYDSTFYAFLSQKGVKLVFLSIDDPKHKSRWENEIKLLNLKGYHILAGPNLKKSVTDIVFDNEPVSIPRYVLVDEAGKILSANFTRPSNASFKQEMNKLLVTDK
jgi:thiol-disulfide isomerase/thioredoxin